MNNLKSIFFIFLLTNFPFIVFSQSSYKYGNTYKIKIPEYMSEMDLDNDDASLQYGNIFKETYIIVVDESKKEFIDVYTTVDLYDKNLSPLQNYINFQFQSIKANYNITKTSNPIIIDAGGNVGKIYKIEFVMDDFSVYGVLCFVEGENKLYMIYFWTLKENKDLYKDDMIKTAKSFREI